MYNWKWNLSELKNDKDISVFSCFSCGGGSTMGYKRAGFKVIGNVEIDPKINAMYVKNHHPKYNFEMDLREFNKRDDLPEELFHLDILDGSPPCTTFSMAGKREKVWGKEKAFREGQKKQRLDDLFFTFLDTVEKLQPKVVIAENVAGLVVGNAKGYVNAIIKKFKEIGYSVQLFKLNAALMDTPQARERVFFIANNQNYSKLILDFQHPIIKFGEVRTEHGKPLINAPLAKKRLRFLKPSDTCMADIIARTEHKTGSNFNNSIFQDHKVATTVSSGNSIYRAYDKMYVSDGDLINISTFPQDYDFNGNPIQYVVGMSVPPNMMANIATEVYKQWLK